MEEFCFKHTGLPIPDLRLQYEIDVPNRTVRLELGDIFDSALLISFARRFLGEEKGIQVIDNKSFEAIGPAYIESRYKLEAMVGGQLFDIEIMQLGAWERRPGTLPAFTVSMQKRK